jgi:hypothetical protein
MGAKGALERFSGFRAPSLTAGALVFLHELSAPYTLGQPPREARWQRVLDRPERDWAAALDRACQACVQAWPEQLDGFFGEIQFVDEPAHAIRRGIEGAQRLAGLSVDHGGPWDHRTLLASVGQEMRSLQSKQVAGSVVHAVGGRGDDGTDAPRRRGAQRALGA